MAGNVTHRMDGSRGLIGREQELAAVNALLRGAEQGCGGSLVFIGEPGSGKSRLLAEARNPDGFTTLAVVGTESECDLDRSALVTLLRPVRRHIERLPKGHRSALAWLDGQRPGNDPDRLALGLAVFELLVLAAEERPVVVVVDDLHWVDPVSRQILGFVARRIEFERVAFLAAGRFLPDWEQLPGTVALRPLAVTAVAELIEGIAEDVGVRLHEAAGGNVLAMLETARLLRPPQLRGTEPLPVQLPVGELITKRVRRSLATLPEATVRGLLVLSLDSSLTDGQIEAALSKVGAGVEDLESAQDGNLLLPDRLQFRHPLVRTAVTAAASPADRRAAHGALAVVLVQDHTRALMHRAQAGVGSDPILAAQLREEAEAACGSSPAASALFAELAAARTADPADRCSHLLLAAESFLALARPDETVRCLNEAATLVPTGAGHLRVRGRLLILQGREQEGADLLRASAEAVRPTDPDAAVALLIEATLPLIRRGMSAATDALSLEAMEVAEQASPSIRNRAAVVRGIALVMNEKYAEGLPLALSYEEVLRVEGPVRAGRFLAETIGFALAWTRQTEAAERLFGQLVAAAHSSGAYDAIPATLSARAAMETYRYFPTAVEVARQAIVAAVELGQHGLAWTPRKTLAYASATMGDRAFLDEACLPLDSAPNLDDRVMGAMARAHFALAEDRPDDVIALLGGLPLEGGADTMFRWDFDMALALLRTNRPDEARRYIEFLDSRSGGGPWLAGCSLWGHAELSDDWAEAVSGYEKALVHFEGATPTIGGRCELWFARRWRERGDKSTARHYANRAHDRFHTIGATGWVRATIRELAAIDVSTPGSRSSVDALSARELELARLLVQGHPYRDIADQLFIGLRTVETHASHIYRKLNVRNRVELVTQAASLGIAGKR